MTAPRKQPKPLSPHYSGELSHEFWMRVAALPSGDRAVAYSNGVLLQNMEGDVLRWLTNAERSAAARKRRTK